MMKKSILFTLLCLFCLGSGMTVKAADEVYSVFVDATKTLTFYCDNQRSTRPGDYKELYDPDEVRFMGYNDQVQTIKFDESMKNYNLTTTKNLLFGGGGIQKKQLCCSRQSWKEQITSIQRWYRICP